MFRGAFELLPSADYRLQIVTAAGAVRSEYIISLVAVANTSRR